LIQTRNAKNRVFQKKLTGRERERESNGGCEKRECVWVIGHGGVGADVCRDGDGSNFFFLFFFLFIFDFLKK
jgi:hypothetical protein